jgi:1-deoxy-D-xylulose-5-phosphate reductoisomerase
MVSAMTSERTITVLGATGSIGASTTDLLQREPHRYRVEAVTASKNAKALAKLARDLKARVAAIADPQYYNELKDELAGSGIAAAAGPEAVVEAAQRPADWVMGAISGAAGLRPTLAAVARGAMVALANKECLVCAGTLFMQRAGAAGATILPADSEHNAIFQALGSGQKSDLHRIILTASGGPFRTWTADQIRNATVEQALRHPNWAMGQKVTIDSATMMNKGLELIEAHHLFALPSIQIDVLVHPQSIVHGLVEFRDGSMIAQLSSPDMRVPIAHCLAWPERIDGAAPRLDLAKVANLSFEAPDPAKFPALRVARAAMDAGSGATTILNAANEIAVAAFLAKRLGFGAIVPLVEETLSAAQRRGINHEPENVEDALSIDHVSRTLAAELLPQIAAKAS